MLWDRVKIPWFSHPNTPNHQSFPSSARNLRDSAAKNGTTDKWEFQAGTAVGRQARKGKNEIFSTGETSRSFAAEDRDHICCCLDQKHHSALAPLKQFSAVEAEAKKSQKSPILALFCPPCTQGHTKSPQYPLNVPSHSLSCADNSVSSAAFLNKPKPTSQQNSHLEFHAVFW